jgi:hypothetical protein
VDECKGDCCGEVFNNDFVCHQCAADTIMTPPKYV